MTTMNTSSSTPPINEMLADIEALAAQRRVFKWAAVSSAAMLFATLVVGGAAGVMWYCGT